VLSDLLSNPTFERRLTAVFLGNWFSDQLVYNAVLIDGVPSGQFHRLPDKSFNPARGNYAKLVQAGERLPQIDYTPVTLTYTGADGDQIDFDWSYDRISSAQSSLNMAGPTFKANQWRFPDGTIVWFDYDLKDVCNAFSYQQFGCSIMAGYQAYVLKSVRNNYGRSLSFTNELVSPDGSSVLKTYQLKRVTDETGRYVEFTLSNCPAGVKFACGTLAVSDGQKTVARYEYGASSASPDPAVVLASNYKLRRWYTPTNQTDPYQVVIYDGLFHVSAVTDALGRQARYFPGSLLGGERWKRGDLVSPRTDVAEVTTSIFDDGNSLLQTINPLQKTWRYEYDDARRKVREVTPELGQTRWKYDVRSNLIETCVMPKATTNLDRTCARASGDLVTVLEYMEDVNVWACGNLVTCNRPRKQVDPGSFATDYRWNTATGLPTQILQPADVENNRPQVDFSYADYAGAGGGTLKLLSEKIEKVSAQASIKTTYAYDPLNKFVLRSATTDPNGKAITTCFRFDAVGNLTGVTDPRASTCP
ncbi:MAG TPA: hypothetical protein VN158_03455, partial [Caulobacter sp.]|nr:hypothetical protein [Caulobacter sp.]